MSSQQSNTNLITTTLRRKYSGRTPRRSRICKSRRTLHAAKREQPKMAVSEKLQTLKNLIPAKNEEMKADQLFEETAEYIVFLRTQVEVLQRLIEIYGPNENNKVV